MQDSGNYCSKHPDLEKNYKLLSDKVDGIYEVQGSILDQHAKIFEKLEKIDAGMVVNIGNGIPIEVPMNVIMAKMMLNDGMRNATLGRPNKYYTWFKRSFIALLTIGVSIWMYWYSNITIAGEKEKKATLDSILVHQQGMKEWMNIDGANGEQQDRKLNTISKILEQKFKIIIF